MSWGAIDQREHRNSHFVFWCYMQTSGRPASHPDCFNPAWILNIKLHELLSRLEGTGGKIFLSVARNWKPTLWFLRSRWCLRLETTEVATSEGYQNGSSAIRSTWKWKPSAIRFVIIFYVMFRSFIRLSGIKYKYLKKRRCWSNTIIFLHVLVSSTW